MKISLWIFAHEGDRDVAPRTRAWFGEMAQHLYDRVLWIAPWAPEWYAKHRNGTQLTPKILFDRWYKSSVRPIKPNRSNEHPLQHGLLKPYVEIVQLLHQKGSPVSMPLVMIACG